MKIQETILNRFEEIRETQDQDLKGYFIDEAIRGLETMYTTNLINRDDYLTFKNQLKEMRGM